MTQAQQISSRYDNDGQTFTDSAGVDLVDACQELTRPEYRDGMGTDLVRFIFDDNSAIMVVLDCGWDLGFADCWCWQGCRHDDGCEAGQ